MSQQRVLLYLHGVGNEQGDGWRDALEPALVEIGYPDLSSVDVVAPKYTDALNGVDTSDPIPDITVKPPRGDAARRNRREYDGRRTSIEHLLGPDDPGAGLPGVPLDRVVPVVADRAQQFEQAKNYVQNSHVRAAVLRQVLESLPSGGRVCIVAHSLGSVVAADVLCRLPRDLYVSGLVTIGSPLAHAHLRPEGLMKSLVEPPTNLAWWVNFWSRADVVPARRGVSTSMPWVLDQRITTSLDPRTAHGADMYLDTTPVASIVGRGLFGSTSKEVVLAERSMDVRLDETEVVVVLQLRFAHLVMEALEGEQRERYAEAVRRKQATDVALLTARCQELGRPVPTLVARLAVDLTDPLSEVPVPVAPALPDEVDIVRVLLDIATGNVVAPFEIKVAKSVQESAMERLTHEMGRTARLGADVFDSLDKARKELKGSVNWVKWTALGLGAAAITAATGGLVLMAAPGVAGAAAVTSALAAFGPGGMIGGLLTAGTFVGAGGGGIAYGLAAPGTSAEAVEAVVAVQLASAILRKQRGLPQDEWTWLNLADAADIVARALADRRAVSDDSAESVNDLQRKLDAINKALDYLDRHGLGPTPYALPVAPD